MKHVSLLMLFAFAGALPTAAQTITVTNNSGSNILTCLTSTINLTASSVGFTPTTTYTWSSPGTTLTGATVNIVTPGTFTVINMNGSSMITHTITISVNTVSPVSSISSTFVVVTGSAAPAVTMAAVSPTVDITHFVYSPVGGTFVTNTTSMSYVPSGPGTYTHCIIWQVNGCSSCKTFTVVSGTVLLEEHAPESDLLVFRDQSGSVRVDFSRESAFALYDLSGRCLRNFSVKKETGFSARLDLQPGIYFLLSTTYGARVRFVIE